MDTAISAADANRAFSRLLREVTAHGKPVARLVPCDAADAARGAARAELLARLSAQPVVDVGRWSRDDLYER